MFTVNPPSIQGAMLWWVQEEPSRPRPRPMLFSHQPYKGY